MLPQGPILEPLSALNAPLKTCFVTHLNRERQFGMKVEKDKFDALLKRLLKQKPEKTQEIKGTPDKRSPIIPKPRPSEPR